LLKICGASVHENFGVGKTVAGVRPAVLSGFSFDDRWAPPVPDPKLGDERECGLANPS
jgi:hypothetical protein